jgi:hypothetical protein
MSAAAMPDPTAAVPDPIASLTERFRRSRMSLEQKLSQVDEAVGLSKSVVSGFAKSATDSGPVKLSRMEQRAYSEEELTEAEPEADDDAA